MIIIKNLVYKAFSSLAAAVLSRYDDNDHPGITFKMNTSFIQS